MDPQHPVERYYDRNTRRFLAFGGGSASGAIHRQLWGPGVATVREAAGYVNRLLEDALRGVELPGHPVFLDLGCGVGGTLLHLARAFPAASLHGVTISRRQVEIARRAAERSGVESRCRFHPSDFESLALGIEADVIVAIESFTHSRSADDFLATVARHLRPGGTLVVIDDFLRRDDERYDDERRNDHKRNDERRNDEPNPDADRLASEFRKGWQVPSLCTSRSLIERARAAGLELVENRDLSGLIRLGRPRDRLIGVVAPLVKRLGLADVPFFGNLVGGNALHAGLVSGVFEYRWLCFCYSR